MRQLRYYIFLCLIIGNTSWSYSAGKDSTSNAKFDSYFYEGVLQSNLNHYNESFDLLMHAASINPENAALSYQLSRVYYALDNQKGMTKLMEKAYTLEPSNKTYGESLASLYFTSGKFNEAAGIYEKLIKQYPDQDELKHKLAQLYARSGDIKKAIKVYDELQKQNASSPSEEAEYINVKAQLYNMVGAKNDALNEYKKLADKYPDVSEFSLQLIGAYLEAEHYEEAKKYLNKLGLTDGTDLGYNVSLAQYYLGVNKEEAAFDIIQKLINDSSLETPQKLAILLAFANNQRDDKGVPSNKYNNLFEKIIQDNPHNPDARIAYAKMLEAQGKHELAIKTVRPITEFSPQNNNAWNILLQDALVKQDTTEIVKISSEAIKYLPQEAPYYFYGAIGLFMQGKKKEAKDLLLEAVKNVPETSAAPLSEVYAQLGDLVSEEGDIAKSFDYYEKAIKLNPQNTTALNNYAYALGNHGGDLAKAERLSAMSVKLQPETAVFLDTYGWIFFLQKNYTLAKLYIQKAYDLSAKDPDADVVEHLGDVYYMLNNKEKALELWNEAKALKNGGSKNLDEKIKKQKYIPEKK
ncbi:tetratricopeptide repeat protein [Porphyromonas pogonae]|uniref:tetratricopeptide repeat protein n=1 Tax=Porphyromonas pogonae TaxID=867595 RepID=UPI002E7A8CBB|nr:tetratricopeptide repeat protein [Porphyromonas pogonae]